MNFWKTFFIVAILLCSNLILQPGVKAAPLSQETMSCEQEVIVQADDWLSKIAEKVYGDVFAYPATAVMVKRLNDRDRPMLLAAVFWAPSVLSVLGQLLGIGYATQEIAGQVIVMPTTIGWLINLMSLVIGIWSLVELGCLRGTPGPNRHGPDPLAGRA